MQGMRVLFLLLISSVCVAQEDCHSLVRAASRGSLEYLAQLLDKGIDPNKKDLHGDIALIQAVLYGKVDCVKLLLEKGADHQVRNENRWTALQLAEFEADHFGTKNEVVAILKSVAVKK